MDWPVLTRPSVAGSHAPNDTCWLQLKQAEICAGFLESSKQSHASTLLRSTARESSTARYFAAMKMLAQVRGLPLSVLIPARVSLT